MHPDVHLQPSLFHPPHLSSQVGGYPLQPHPSLLTLLPREDQTSPTNQNSGRRFHTGTCTALSPSLFSKLQKFDLCPYNSLRGRGLIPLPLWISWGHPPHLPLPHFLPACATFPRLGCRSFTPDLTCESPHTCTKSSEQGWGRASPINESSPAKATIGRI